MTELLANIAIEVGRPYFLVSIFLLGLWGPYRRDFINLVSLVLFSFLWIAMWKKLIAKPLPAFLNNPQGYAFPSGHMHCTTLIWSYVAYKLRKFPFILIAAPVLIILEGWALIYKGYHDLADVVAGACAALALVGANLYLWKTYRWENHHDRIALGCALAASFCFLFLNQKFVQYIYLALIWAWFAILMLTERYYAYQQTRLQGS